MILFMLILAGGASMVSAQKRWFKPAEGFVPNQKTAVRVAEAVLSPIYGEEKIISERPFTAELKGDVWTVKGSLPEGYIGGVAEIRISKRTGEILGATHEK